MKLSEAQTFVGLPVFLNPGMMKNAFFFKDEEGRILGAGACGYERIIWTGERENVRRVECGSDTYEALKIACADNASSMTPPGDI